VWKAIINFPRGAEKIVESPDRIIVHFIEELGWVLFTSEFDTFGVRFDEIEDFHVFEVGDVVA
jgi:hypothetical protein